MVDLCRHHESIAQTLARGRAIQCCSPAQMTRFWCTVNQSLVTLSSQHANAPILHECKDWTYGQPSDIPCEMPTLDTEGAAP